MQTNIPTVLSCYAGGERREEKDCMMRTETRANCGDWHAISNKTISLISHAITLSSKVAPDTRSEVVVGTLVSRQMLTVQCQDSQYPPTTCHLASFWSNTFFMLITRPQPVSGSSPPPPAWDDFLIFPLTMTFLSLLRQLSTCLR